MPLGKRSDCGDARFAGYEIPFTDNAPLALTETVMQTLGFDFALCPISHPAYRPPAPSLHDPSHPYPEVLSSKQRLYFQNSQYSGRMVAATSKWIDCDDPSSAAARDACCKWLTQELSWAMFLGLHAVLVDTPKHGPDCARLARTLAGFLSQETVATHLWVRIPVFAPSSARPEGAATMGETDGSGHLLEDEGEDTWDWWNTLRCLNEHSSSLGVALELTESLPSSESLLRWMGENVKCCIIPQSIFITNRQGYPVLPKRHQNFLAMLMERGVQIVFSPSQNQNILASLGLSDAAPGAPDAPAAPHPHKIYQEYLSYFFRNLPEPSDRESHEIEYRDYLQHPLQPLQDNLESSTYEVFEFDKMKYVQYEEAVYRALLDRVPDSEASTTTVSLMVVGAGRGPLVRASLRAANRSGRKLRVYAVEKNPHAVVVLRRMVEDEPEMHGVVTIVHCDMRHWNAPEKADILVSELLGSFGDNELSPECLDGAQRFLKSDGISIPQAYTSYLQPITSHKLWTDVRSFRAATTKDSTTALETPFVVKMHKISKLSTIEEVFTFVHPNRSEEEGRPIDNERHIRIEFSRPEDSGNCLVHGFAGYFNCKLYKDVNLGIHPEQHTPDMHSWFPIFFPIQTPYTWCGEDKLSVEMWRCVSPQRVWYEWAIVGPLPGNLHNVNGRSYFVGL